MSADYSFQADQIRQSVYYAMAHVEDAAKAFNDPTKERLRIAAQLAGALELAYANMAAADLLVSEYSSEKIAKGAFDLLDALEAEQKRRAEAAVPKPLCTSCNSLLLDGGVKDGDEHLCLSCAGEAST